MLRNVIVLTDNEQKRSSFLQNLGMTIAPSTLCMVTTPTKLFRFEVFSVLTDDRKLNDYITTRDGIIIMLIGDKFTKNMANRIENIVKQSPNMPILFLVEKYSQSSNTTTYLERFTQTENRKSFLIDYTNVSHIPTYVFEEEAKSWFNDVLIRFGPRKKSKLTSANISNEELVKSFENTTLPLELWDHYGRLRIVHYSLITRGYQNTIDPNGWLCTSWKKYKTSIGHGNLWHYTLTRFWTNILYELPQKDNYKTFNQLYNDNPDIHNGGLFRQYYSDDILFTPHARNHWVEPTCPSHSSSVS